MVPPCLRLHHISTRDSRLRHRFRAAGGLLNVNCNTPHTEPRMHGGLVRSGSPPRWEEHRNDVGTACGDEVLPDYSEPRFAWRLD